MNAAHLSPRRRDRVRVARRRRRAHRRDDLPDLPRAPPPRGRQRDRAGADRHLDAVPAHGRRARASCSTPTSSPAARPAAAGSSGMPGIRDQHTGCVGAYLVEHDLFDFLLFSLPDNDAWSHRNGPHAQVTSIAAADRQLERLMHAAGGAGRVPRRARGDRDLRPLAGGGRGADPARSRRSPTSTSRTPERGALGRRRGRALPGAARGDGLRARRRPTRRAGRQRSLEAVARARRRRPGAVDARAGTRRGRRSAAAAASCASRPAATSIDAAARRWSVEGDLGRARAEVQDGRLLCTEYPDALARSGRR